MGLLAGKLCGQDRATHGAVPGARLPGVVMWPAGSYGNGYFCTPSSKLAPRTVASVVIPPPPHTHLVMLLCPTTYWFP